MTATNGSVKSNVEVKPSENVIARFFADTRIWDSMATGQNMLPISSLGLAVLAVSSSQVYTMLADVGSYLADPRRGCTDDVN